VAEEEFEGGWLGTDVGRQVRPVLRRRPLKRLLAALRQLLRR
jgi:hypothetical protein